jgi:predicted nucleic acid-binding protein
LSLYVLDASVAVKWFLPASDEPFASQARQMLQEWTDETVTLLVPDLFFAEVANVLLKAVRARRCSLQEAELSLARLEAADIPSFSSLKLLEQAFAIATRHGRSLYDSLYVALAAKSKAQLITADERLVNALAGHYSIRWLGAL